MDLLDPAERTARGAVTQAEITGRPAPEPGSVFEASWRDYIFAEIWNRPGLERRARFLIAISGAAMAHASDQVMDGYVRGALKTGELSLAELREAALHTAVYGGWPTGELVDKAIDRVSEELGLPPYDFPPLRGEPWDAHQRYKDGQAEFHHVMTFAGPQPIEPYHEGGILNFVFAEMWPRRILDQRSRRWITLVGVCEAGVVVPIDSHIHAAMASGNCSPEEMREFVLQYAVHAGWPKASNLTNVVAVMARKVAAGLPFHAHLPE
ncbi:MAG TPA: carboxymuconolactone decarboxylase family protein [Sphingobium sp.]|nr:carboxymuconolactone decarboxylase family protein [Sphingobium sp.]